MKRTHKHEFKTGRSENVEVCRCGRFRFTSKGLQANPPITEVKQIQNHCWHNVELKDQTRIECRCGKMATICEHQGISFWYFCEEHGSGLREVLPEFRAAVESRVSAALTAYVRSEVR